MVEHDHATGRVRGLSCLRCNSLVGLIENHPDIASVLRYCGLEPSDLLGSEPTGERAQKPDALMPVELAALTQCIEVEG